MKKQAEITSGSADGRLLPPAWRLRLDESSRLPDGDALVLGGAPLRLMRLSAAGAEALRGWRAGAAIGDGVGARRLARRLLDAGLAHPEPPAAGDPAQLTVVVPVRDRATELARCLAAIDRRCPIVVVDDGSNDGKAVDTVASRAGASVVRLKPGRGPAAARNAGLRAAQTPFVAFVDSDCVVGPGFPGRLLDHLGDPALAIAVPRIVALERPDGGVLARYEARRSALDMGPRHGLVRPGSPVPYAPSAAMVTRAAALGAGFAEEMRMGEDVDLVWRLIDAGWDVRYDPSVTVEHDHRVAWRAWFSRRVAYNASTAILDRRHPGKVPALTLTRGGVAVWTALVVGQPVVAAAACAVDTAVLARGLRDRVPGHWRLAAALVVRGRLHEGRHVARAVTGPWLPFLLAATAARPRAARRLWAGVAAAALVEWSSQPMPLSALAPRAADDIARCLGIWLGCARERHFGALLPRLSRR